MSVYSSYSGWRSIVFWILWALLLVPGYFAAYGTWLIGSMLHYYYDPVDIVLTVIFGATLFLLMLVAVYTGWHFVKSSRRFPHLMFSLLAGLLIIPILATAGALFSYVQLS